MTRRAALAASPPADAEPDAKPQAVGVALLSRQLVAGCPDCGRPPGLHWNPHGQRWWTCAEIDGIAARIAYGHLPWLVRLLRRPPAGWRP